MRGRKAAVKQTINNWLKIIRVYYVLVKKKKGASQFMCFCQSEPIGTFVWGVFRWCDAQGAVDGEQIIVHTVNLVVPTLNNRQVMFICRSQESK